MVVKGKAVWLSEDVQKRGRKYARQKFGKLPRDLTMNSILTDIFDELDRKHIYRLA